MKIALVVPRSTFLESKMHIPNLGVAYLAARLESLGHTTELFDLNADSLPKDGDYDQLWVSSTAPQRAEVVRIANETKGWKTRRILGGAATWTHPDAYKELGYDMIFGGECDAEESVREILELAEHPNDEGYKFFPTSKTLDWVLPPVRRWNDRYHAHMTDADDKTYRMSTMFGTRGCPMSCAFCLEENQRVLMADWTYKAIRDIKIGESVMSYYNPPFGVSNGCIVPTQVLNVINNGIKRAIRTVAGGRSLISTPDHKIYVDDGHKTRWKLASSSIVGKTRVRLFSPRQVYTFEYKRGWLAGFLAGDGSVHKRGNYDNITLWSRDTVLLETYERWALDIGCVFRRFKHNYGTNGAFPSKYEGHHIDGTQCTKADEAASFLSKISTGNNPTEEYMLGWLAGMYDSDGSCDGETCRIIQSKEVKPYYTEIIEQYLWNCGFTFNIQFRNGINTYCIEPTNFIARCRPILFKKYPKKYTYKSLEKHDVQAVEEVGECQVYDLTTENHSFICEGFIVHNCDSGRAGKVWDRFTRYEPLDLVEYQIKEIASQNFTGIMYYDDVSVLNRSRTLAIMELHRKYNLAWRGFMRSDILVKYGEEFFKELKRGHLIEMFVGVESASNDVKAAINKGTTIEEDTQVLEWGKKYGVHMKASFILGLPGESMESMEATRAWVLKNRPYRVQVGRLIPLAGTPIAEHPELFDLKYEKQPDDNWYYSGDNGQGTRSFVSTSHLSIEQIDTYWHALQAELKREGIRG